jgi:thiosulfate dehydrogenase [quinone] large subunit
MAKDKLYPYLNVMQAAFLVILRVAVGWHFLYEGLVKITDPNWSAFEYLMDSQGIFSGIFKSMASNQGVLAVVDLLNVWGLMLIGGGLILGIFTRFSTICAIILLSFYYLSHPPFLGLEYIMPQEGNYFLVDKTLVEILALAVVYVFPTGHILGIDRLILKLKEYKNK